MTTSVSSNGIAISTHHCGGKLQNIAFFTKAASCNSCSEDKLANCQTAAESSSKEPIVCKKSCCMDNAVFAKLKIENSVTKDVSLSNQIECTFPILNALENLSVAKMKECEHLILPNAPPNFRVSTQVLFQVFLI